MRMRDAKTIERGTQNYTLEVHQDGQENKELKCCSGTVAAEKSGTDSNTLEAQRGKMGREGKNDGW